MMHITYLFDPLCGWCYGASPGLRRLIGAPGVSVALAPTGLFAEEGARPMDARFADYAWSNDQRIEQLTGQRFTERYRELVLADHGRRFDSGPATLALTAVSLSAPARELDALTAIQEARYLDGRDVTSVQELANILDWLNLDAASASFKAAGADLLAINRKRTVAAREAMRAFGGQGVPTLIVSTGKSARMLSGNVLYENDDGTGVKERIAKAITELPA